MEQKINIMQQFFTISPTVRYTTDKIAIFMGAVDLVPNSLDR